MNVCVWVCACARFYETPHKKRYHIDNNTLESSLGYSNTSIAFSLDHRALRVPCVYVYWVNCEVVIALKHLKEKKNRNLKKSNNISALTSDALYWVPETRNKWLCAFCRIRVKIALVDYFKYLACSMFSTLGSSTDYTDGHTCTRMRCERP